jgi:predicted SnoaL-like aldol condensation-catalyzing enzyme
MSDPARGAAGTEAAGSIADRNKAAVRRFVEEVFNAGRLEAIDELVAADYVGREPDVAAAVLGPQGVRRLVGERRRALPGLHVRVVDEIAEEDRVAVRWTATAAAGSWAGISVIRLLGGRQVDALTACERPGAPQSSLRLRA